MIFRIPIQAILLSYQKLELLIFYQLLKITHKCSNKRFLSKKSYKKCFPKVESEGKMNVRRHSQQMRKLHTPIQTNPLDINGPGM